MNAGQVLDIGNNAIYLLISIVTPILLVGLVVGIAISLLQTLTSIQESTLVFVPKMLATFFTILFIMPIIANKIQYFMTSIFDTIVSIS